MKANEEEVKILTDLRAGKLNSMWTNVKQCM